MPSVTTWNRLEPRARSGDMQPGLEARVHDPLWLLGRQWQLGEFQGEDAATPVWVRLRAETAPLRAVRPPGGPPREYDAGTPLETVVEREPADPTDRRMAAEAGLHFARLLRAEGVGRYADTFRATYPLGGPTADSDDASRCYLLVMGARAADGFALAAALRSRLPPAPAIPKPDRPRVEAAAKRFLPWFDALVSTAGADDTAWQPDRFEYRFEAAARSDGADVVLTVPEHEGGALDWHSFVHDTDGALEAPDDSHDVVATLVPARASYAGMPAARFWEFENRRVDFGGIDAAPSDLARMLVLDFATVYSNDWWVVPLELPVGTITNVRSLVVGDTFGDRWLVGPSSDPDWTMYQLTAVGSTAAGARPRLQRLLLPPALTSGLESEPVEDVLLVRDEGANLAWAIERLYEGSAATRVDRVEEWHADLRWRGDTTAHAGAPQQIASLAYQLQSTVPDHWIPLVPEDEAAGRTVLRVSALERPLPDGTPEPILPRGRLLRPGEELLIPDEEVPAEGARVVRAWQYARWTDGSTHLWRSRRKHPGRGIAASGLEWDLVAPWQEPQRALAYEHSVVRITTGAAGDPVDLEQVTPGQRLLVQWTVRNAGTTTWRATGDDRVELVTQGESPGQLAAPSWLAPNRPARISQSLVGPGEAALFIFEIIAPSARGPFEEDYEISALGHGTIEGPGLRIQGRAV